MPLPEELDTANEAKEGYGRGAVKQCEGEGVLVGGEEGICLNPQVRMDVLEIKDVQLRYSIASTFAFAKLILAPESDPNNPEQIGVFCAHFAS